MKSKKGSHVGVILSFIIFITFVVFLYSILQPSIQVKENKEKLLDNLKIEMKQKLSSNIESITFIINETTTDNCVKLEGLLSELKSPNFILKNESGGLISEVRNDNYDLLINRSGLDENFFKIYDSDWFPPATTGSLTPCQTITKDKYVFRSARINDETLLFIINETKNEYIADYESLKSELNIPAGSDFSFSFTDKKNILIETSSKNVSASVYAEEIPLQYFDDEANLNTGFLTIRVW